MPRTQLLQKDKKFAYDDKCKVSFMELKTRLTTTQILTLSSGMEGFVIYSDVSLKGLDYVLMQYRKVVTYTSRQLRLYKENYPTHNLKFVAMDCAFKIWRHYMYEAKFEIFINRKSLKYVLTQPNLNMGQRR